MIKNERTETYNAIQQESRDMNESNDCVVKMVSLALTIPYSDAHDLCARYGRTERKGMYHHQWARLLQDYGVKIERMNPRHFIDQYPGEHSGLKNVTTHHMDRFSKVWADGHRYIITTRGHVLYVENGRNHDWTRGTAHRAVAIYRIKE